MALTPNQIVVLTSLRDFGKADDVTLSVYVHQLGAIDMSSSGVRTRRSELTRKGFVEVVGTRKMRSGRSAAVYAISKTGRTALRASTLAEAV